MTVQISTKLNRSHLVTGKTAFILPCLARTDIDRQLAGEQIVSVENSMGVVHQSRGVLDPISDKLKSEPEIIACLANATLGVDWDHLIDDYDAIRNLIQQVVPGFDDYNTRLRQPGGFYLPNVARSGQFKQGRATFSLRSLPENQRQEDEYWMIAIRRHDQFNTTIYGNDGRDRGSINERRVILMNPDDMEEAGLKAKQIVSILSCYDGVTRQIDHFKVVPYSIPRKNVATYFPEANPLVPVNLIAKKSQTPCSKSVVVQLVVENVN